MPGSTNKNKSNIDSVVILGLDSLQVGGDTSLQLSKLTDSAWPIAVPPWISGFDPFSTLPEHVISRLRPGTRRTAGESTAAVFASAAVCAGFSSVPLTYHKSMADADATPITLRTTDTANVRISIFVLGMSLRSPFTS